MLMLSGFTKDEFEDPDNYIKQLEVILGSYPEWVVKHVTDPETGLQRRVMAPPKIAEVVVSCDKLLREKQEREERERQADLARQRDAIKIRRRIALCHLWMRANEIGDKTARAKINAFTQEERKAALQMTMREAVDLWPHAVMTRPLDQYGPLNEELPL